MKGPLEVGELSSKVGPVGTGGGFHQLNSQRLGSCGIEELALTRVRVFLENTRKGKGKRARLLSVHAWW